MCVCVCAYVMLYVFVIFKDITLINRFDELEVSSESFSQLILQGRFHTSSLWGGVCFFFQNSYAGEDNQILHTKVQQGTGVGVFKYLDQFTQRN